ncbi:MAG: hypothetical protein WB421_13775, partial [Terriglobales bacterium]
MTQETKTKSFNRCTRCGCEGHKKTTCKSETVLPSMSFYHRYKKQIDEYHKSDYYKKYLKEYRKTYDTLYNERRREKYA